MIGHSVFTYSAPVTMTKTTARASITLQQYADWQQQFTVDALRGQRYGQSFCNRFGVHDNLLFFTQEIDWCERYIKDKYIDRPRV